MSNDDGDSFVEATAINEKYLDNNDLSNMHTIPLCVTTPNATDSTYTTIATATSVSTTTEVRRHSDIRVDDLAWEVWL